MANLTLLGVFGDCFHDRHFVNHVTLHSLQPYTYLRRVFRAPTDTMNDMTGGFFFKKKKKKTFILFFIESKISDSK